MNKLQQRLADKRANEEAGFTLIELLVVIVILGILAAVVVFSVRGITDRGNNSACEATRTAVLTGAEAAYAQTGAFPATLAGMAAGGFIGNGGGKIVGDVFTGKNFTVTYTPGTAAVVGPPAVPATAATAVGNAIPAAAAGCPT